MKRLLSALSVSLLLFGAGELIPLQEAQAASLLKLCKKHKISKGTWTGVYKGKWAEGSTTLNHTLVVARAKADGSATVYYAHGRQAKWGINRSRCRRHKGKFIDDNTLKIDFGNNRTAWYDFFDTHVGGRYVSSGGTTRGQFAKAN